MQGEVRVLIRVVQGEAWQRKEAGSLGEMGERMDLSGWDI